jgi:hypothetical protein
LKSTGPRGPWGFESLALRQLLKHLHHSSFIQRVVSHAQLGSVRSGATYSDAGSYLRCLEKIEQNSLCARVLGILKPSAP